MMREKLKKLSVISAVITVILFSLLNHSTTAFTSAASGTPGSLVADGPTVFGTKCALCHGKDGTGQANWKAKGQPDFTNVEWQHSRTDAQIAETVKNGKGKFMPAFKAKLSDEEVAAVVTRIRAFGKKK